MRSVSLVFGVGAALLLSAFSDGADADSPRVSRGRQINHVPVSARTDAAAHSSRGRQADRRSGHGKRKPPKSKAQSAAPTGHVAHSRTRDVFTRRNNPVFQPGPAGPVEGGNIVAPSLPAAPVTQLPPQLAPTIMPAVGTLADLLASDMSQGSEAMPNNFNGSWASHPQSKPNGWRNGAYTQIMPWGALYEQAGGNPTPAKANIADVQAWARYDDGSWYRVLWDSGAPGGQQGKLFPENWQSANGSVTPGGGSTSAKTQQLGDGTTTVQLGQGSPNPRGYLYHFWSSHRYDFRNGPKPMSTLAAVVVTVRARIEPASYDPNARYVLAMAADRYGPNGENGWEQMVGRFKKLDANWRLYTATIGAVSTLPGPISGVQSDTEYR
jgi:hypothetical protein